jgi:hypothetical protein
VEVDEPGQHGVAGHVHHLGAGRQLNLGVGADGGDHAVGDEDGRVLERVQVGAGQHRAAAQRQGPAVRLPRRVRGQCVRGDAPGQYQRQPERADQQPTTDPPARAPRAMS